MNVPPRRALVPWGEITPSDLHEQGPPEWVRDLRGERQIGLHVFGTHGISLGILAMRCERRAGDVLVPLTMAIAETPLTVSDDIA